MVIPEAQAEATTALKRRWMLQGKRQPAFRGLFSGGACAMAHHQLNTNLSKFSNQSEPLAIREMGFTVEVTTSFTCASPLHLSTAPFVSYLETPSRLDPLHIPP